MPCMELFSWAAPHFGSFLQAAGIICGLFFTAASFRADTRSRRIHNLITLTEQHRNIWEALHVKPPLARILNPDADLHARQLTREELEFVNICILHLNCWYYAINEREVRAPEGLGTDIKTFFALPIPRAVWERNRAFQDEEFVEYVESKAGMLPRQ